MADCPECELCCALGICCPPQSAEQRAGMIAVLKRRHPDLSQRLAEQRADLMLTRHNQFRYLRMLTDIAGMTA